MLFIITGPSGSGKSSLVKKTLGKLKGAVFCVSHTTRPLRPGEKNGEDYYFVSKEEFELLIKEDKLVEWAVVHNNYYGTSKREIEKKSISNDILLDIDVQGAGQIRDKFRKAVFIFVLPPSFEELKARLKKRAEDSPEEIRKRLKISVREIREYHNFDYVIINDKFDAAAEELRSIIISTRCQLDIRQKEIVSILQSFAKEES